MSEAKSVWREFLLDLMDIFLFRFRTCRRVISREIVMNVKGLTAHHLRCGDPSHPGCQMHYCPEHCEALCSHEDDGPDGDEDDIEPDVWEPKKDKRGQERIEA